MAKLALSLVSLRGLWSDNCGRWKEVVAGGCCPTVLLAVASLREILEATSIGNVRPQRVNNKGSVSTTGIYKRRLQGTLFPREMRLRPQAFLKHLH